MKWDYTDTAATALLDYRHPAIRALVAAKRWDSLNEQGKILSIYNYVRDEILFGYNTTDAIPASRVLQDGYGQCNTKGVLFMALLRAVGIPCRMHGFRIDKRLQKGAITGIYYRLSPDEILHSWVEVYYNGRWVNLEGFILDLAYLTQLQAKFRSCSGSFCGYGAAVEDLQNPPIYWEGGDTYIQKEGIVADLGIYPTPDAFFAEHGQQLRAAKEWLYKHAVRHLMNRNIRRIRGAAREAAREAARG